jgi:hypothetical protein
MLCWSRRVVAANARGRDVAALRGSSPRLLVISHLPLINLTQLVGGAIGEVDGEVIAVVRCLCMSAEPGLVRHGSSRPALRPGGSALECQSISISTDAAECELSSQPPISGPVLGWQRSAPTPRNRRRNQEATRRTVRRYEAPDNRVVSRHPLLDKLDC